MWGAFPGGTIAPVAAAVVCAEASSAAATENTDGRAGDAQYQSDPLLPLRQADHGHADHHGVVAGERKVDEYDLRQRDKVLGPNDQAKTFPPAGISKARCRTLRRSALVRRAVAV